MINIAKKLVDMFADRATKLFVYGIANSSNCMAIINVMSMAV
jgi:hypothetical protein